MSGLVDTRPPYTVLLAEDSEHDIVAIERAWRQNHIPSPLQVVRDGETCLDYLLHRDGYAAPNAPDKPGILLLDLKMSKLDGLGVLRVLHADLVLRTLPVVVLTTSNQEGDRRRSYELGANAYIVKPIDFSRLSDAIGRIYRFWEIVELPV